MTKWVQIWFTSSLTSLLQVCTVKIFIFHFYLYLWQSKSNDVLWVEKGLGPLGVKNIAYDKRGETMHHQMRNNSMYDDCAERL